MASAAPSLVSLAEGLVPPILAVGDFQLRPLRLGDELPWHAYLADPRVTEHTSIPAADLAAIRRSVERHMQEYSTATSCRWALADADGALVGTCGFSNWSLTHQHAELVYDLSPSHWGRGLMRQAVRAALDWAFLVAGFHRVHAFVMTTNQPSIAVLEHCGFAREGTLRHFRMARDRPRDFHVYARLHEGKGSSNAEGLLG
jgi:RimJ/RimL family protein N-acetyltransferase